jgi:hypothetical protein
MYHVSITILALGLLMTGWIAFQAWIRAQTPGMREDADVLRGRFGSCGACFGFEDCRIPDSITHTDVVKVDPVDEVAL